MQGVKGVGPIPIGRYTIGAPTTYKHTVNAMPLQRVGPNPTGRDGFLIHAGRQDGKQTASKGCIILDKPIRAAIAASGARNLIVGP
jgi:hypothetical protein